MDSIASRRHVLIVENNASDSEVMVKLLERGAEDLCITVSRDADEALQALTGSSDGSPNLVILDLGLVGTDGRDLLRIIKSHPSLCHIPVVVFSGSLRERDVQDAYEMGASAFIRKPGGFQDFVDVVRRIQEYWCNAVELPTNKSAELTR